MQPGPPINVKVKMLRRGTEWELEVTEDGKSQTMYLWKRPRISDNGEQEEIYILARPTGERIVDNPDSAVVWKYDSWDRNGNGKVEFDECMHRTICSVVIADGLLFCPDFSGLLHCLDAKTGRRHWTCDLLAACWSTPLVADGRLFVCDEDGDVAIFRLSADPKEAGAVQKIDPSTATIPAELQPLHEINMANSTYSNPAAANGVLYIANKDHLFAIAWDAAPTP